LLREIGTTPVIPGRRNRKRAIRYDRQRYRDRHLIENAFCRIKDFRRVATRYDKLAANFLSGMALATAIVFWLRMSLDPKSGGGKSAEWVQSGSPFRCGIKPKCVR